IDLARSYFVGDSDKDIELARSLGLKCVRISGGSRHIEPSENFEWTAERTILAKRLREAVDHILRDLKKSPH
ncbi:MAG: HAD hydrolase-like protein, partial [Bacteroidota bacterium]